MMIIILQKNIIFIILIFFFFKSFGTRYKRIICSRIEIDDYIIRNDKYYLKFDIVKKFNSYIKLCQKNELFDKKKYPLLKNPKISVIIPIYNGGRYLNYSLRTIQNQKLKEVEIIIILM